MIEDEMNILYSSKSGQWDKVIAFSAKDVATILNLPLSSITRYMSLVNATTKKSLLKYS